MTQTSFYIYRVGQERETRKVDLPAEPGFRALNELILPLLDGAANMEHVSVLFEGRPSDMFVDELGAIPFGERGPLPVNEAATAIYHAAGLARNAAYRAAGVRLDASADTSTWPQIHGTAVVFTRRVWF